MARKRCGSFLGRLGDFPIYISSAGPISTGMQRRRNYGLAPDFRYAVASSLISRTDLADQRVVCHFV